MNIRLRLATSGNQAFLCELNRLAYEDVVKSQFGTWDDLAQRQYFKGKLQRGVFQVVELDRRPVGAVWSSEQEDHVLLHELLVLPEFQEQGIGTRILRLEIERAETLRKPIRLHTLVLNHAQEFFRRHGFKEIGRSKDYVEMERSG